MPIDAGGDGANGQASKRDRGEVREHGREEKRIRGEGGMRQWGRAQSRNGHGN